MLDRTVLTDLSAMKWTRYKSYTYTTFREYEWDNLDKLMIVPQFYDPTSDRWVNDASEIEGLDPYYLGKIADAMPNPDPNGEELQSILHFNMVGLNYQNLIGYDPSENGVRDMRLFGFKPLAKNYESKLDSIYSSHQLVMNNNTIEPRLTQIGWTVEFRGHDTTDSLPTYFYSYGNNNNIMGPADVAARTEYVRHVSVIPALLRNDKQHYYTTDSKKVDASVETMPNDWSSASLLLHVFHADIPLGAARGTGSLAQGDHLKELTPEEIKSEIDNGTIQVEVEYHAPSQTDADNISVSKVDPNKAGVYKHTFKRKFGAGTWIQTYQYVYIDEIAPEEVTVDRDIRLHKPDGTVETIPQTSTFTRTVTINAETGEKTSSEWKQTGSLDAYTASTIDFNGEMWTPDRNAEAIEVDPTSDPADVDIYYSVKKAEPQQEEQPVQESEAGEKNDLPETSDMAGLAVPFATVAFAALTGAFWAPRRKRK